MSDSLFPDDGGALTVTWSPSVLTEYLCVCLSAPALLLTWTLLGARSAAVFKVLGSPVTPRPRSIAARHAPPLSLRFWPTQLAILVAFRLDRAAS